MGETAADHEVEKKEKKEKNVNEDGKEEKKKKDKKEGKDKEDKEGGCGKEKEKKKKNPEDKNDPAKLRQKLEKIETKIQALMTKKEEILKLINEANAQDVIYKDYAQRPCPPVLFNYKIFDWVFDLSCKIDAIVPGLSTFYSCAIPSVAKVELQYLRDYAGMTGGIGLKSNPMGGYNPIVDVSGVVGTDMFSVGTDIGFDVLTREVYKLNAGLSFNTDLLVASVELDRLDTMKVSCHYLVNPLTKTAIATELKHSFSANATALTIGAQHAFLPFTMVKGRISTQGRVYALVQQGLWEKFFLTVGGEVDFMETAMVPKVGLSIALRI